MNLEIGLARPGRSKAALFDNYETIHDPRSPSPATRSAWPPTGPHMQSRSLRTFIMKGPPRSGPSAWQCTPQSVQSSLGTAYLCTTSYGW